MKKPRTTPTLKQKKFARKYVENGGNATQAALEVYNSNYDSASVQGSQNLDKPAVIEEINRLLDKTGLNDDSYIAGSMKTIIDNGVGGKATAKEALNALNMLLKLKNAYPNNVKRTATFRLNYDAPSQSVAKLTEAITQMNNTTASLLEDLKSKE